VEQVVSAFPVEARPLTRCSECNEPLTPIDRGEARDFVPPNVYETHREFLRCSRCERIYWKGSHVIKMALPARKKKERAGPLVPGRLQNNGKRFRKNDK
jgi:uncharacterized protein with PIN domain